jgi:hypothetical protein
MDLEAYRCNPEDDEDNDIENNEILYKALKGQSKERLLSYHVQEVNQQHHHLCQYINRIKNALESVLQQLEAPIQQESVKLGSNILTSLRGRGVTVGSIQDGRNRVVIELA